MDAFKLHEYTTENYRKYLKSFTLISDERIKNMVEKAFEKESFIPQPLIQFNPSYEKGESLDELSKDHNLHPDIPATVGNFKLYKHQYEALNLGLSEKGFVVTSGTGSGKSLTYITTAFNYILNNQDQQGIKAVFVYPMNALLNSQKEEICKFHLNYLKSKVYMDESLLQGLSIKEKIEKIESENNVSFPISYGTYSGQNRDGREDLQKNPPDIILTNYMMLELMMTRHNESWFRDSIESNLKFLVFDELHTYRGRKGADVSILNRRILNSVKNDVTCIGTSATMITDDSEQDRKSVVADVANKIFSTPFEAGQVIEESLSLSTNFKNGIPSKADITTSLISTVCASNPNAEDFKSHPVVGWLEHVIALREVGYQKLRGTPKSLDSISTEFSNYTNLDFQNARDKILEVLQWAENLNKKGESILPFKLHQFISQTSTVYVTLDPPEKRQISIESGRYTKKEGGHNDIYLYPVLFSRYSGHEFLCTALDFENEIVKPRDPSEFAKPPTQKELKGKKLSYKYFPKGYIVFPHDNEELWNESLEENLPETWFQEVRNTRTLKSFYRYQLPTKIYLKENGQFSFDNDTDYDSWAWYVPLKLRVDITAGVIYEDVKTNENTKLMRLGNEGRSTATTTLTYNTIKALFDQNEESSKQKVLSFTDNRQDASLQAGHFNDFFSVIKLRSALYHALSHDNGGLDINNISEEILKKLNLKESEYAKYPNDDWPDEDNETALKKYILIRLFYELKYGWRYNFPNLEQTGLLKIEYKKLRAFVQQEEIMQGSEYLKELSEEERYEFLEQVLNYFRTSYAVYNRYIADQLNEVENEIKNKLDSGKLWALDENEKIEKPYYLVIQQPGKTRKYIYKASMGPRSKLGKYLKSNYDQKGINIKEKQRYEEAISDLCEVLRKGNYLVKDEIKGDKATVDGYRLRLDKVIWKKGEGKTISADKIRIKNYESIKLTPNQYFKELYKFDFSAYKKPIFGHEHTGQLSSEDRIKREEGFREGNISALFCSPTMELGIDIADLNVVHMRNVPPNPANYAQRSGRAGRSGQAAVIFTYCSSFSPHDKNYYQNKEKMVAGEVVPPRMQLSNEELLKAHLNAFMLMKLKINSVNNSVAEILDTSNITELPLRNQLQSYIQDQIQNHSSKWITQFMDIIKDILPELQDSFWFKEEWVARNTQQFLINFEKTFDRWRQLYWNALETKRNAEQVINDPTIKNDEKRRAKSQRNVAERQMDLLVNSPGLEFGNESEFYVFRYLASEGFLPGYNFTRLPVRAFVGYKQQDEGEYISRPRFIALREFGPHNLIYHNGNKYHINRMLSIDTENRLRSLKISKQTGYAFLDHETNANNDPITNNELSGQDNVEILNNCLEISESEGRPQSRISCEEEERMSRGFIITHHFRYINGIENTRKAMIKRGNQPLLNLIYGPATELIQTNKKWRHSQSDGFNIDKRNGKWLREKDLDDPDTNENKKEVLLFARDTADSLYIQPLEALELKPEQIITLSFALKRGIESLFQIEEREIRVEPVGNPEAPNILVYEASEGSLGILSQLVRTPQKLKHVFKEAYQIMGFDVEKRENKYPEKPKANYEDLLSYFNQPYHDILDRFSIKTSLETLMDCSVEELINSRDRQDQYSYLMRTYDNSSVMEKKLIDYLYKNGYALPDDTQINVKEFYISADFVYRTQSGPVLVFCDGNVHDDPNIIKEDDHKRKLLKDKGYDIIVWNYREPLDELVTKRKDIFRKIN